MKIIIEHDDGKEEVFQYVTDAYLAVRQNEPTKGDGEVAIFPETKSYSWGSRLRELVKEVRQSLIELDDTLREIRHADTK